MKLLTMKKISDGDYIYTEDEAPLIEYMVKLETDSEKTVYDLLHEDAKTILPVWDSMLWAINKSSHVRDEYVTYYFMPSEQEPAVGETFELDDIKWERIA